LPFSPMHLTIPPSRLKKSPINAQLLRVYIHQLLDSEDVWFHDAVWDVYNDLGTHLQQISLTKLRRHFSVVLATGFPEYFYYFDDGNCIEESHEIKDFPILFTGLKQTTFELGGLFVLEKYNHQHYELYDFYGNSLLGAPCHDLDLLANGKFVSRLLPGLAPQGFCLYQASFKKEHVDDSQSQVEVSFIKNYGDLPSGSMHVLHIGGRDEFDPERVCDDQFSQITSKVAAIKMLNKCGNKEVTSMSMRPWYVQDAEVAILAIKKNPLAYTLLDEKIRKNERVIQALLQSACDVNSYIVEYKINPADYLPIETIGGLIKHSKINMNCLPGDLQKNPTLLHIAAEHDKYFLKFTELLAPQLLSDKELMLLAARNEADIFNRVSSEMLEDRQWVSSVLERNFKALVYAPESIKNDRDLIAEALSKQTSQLSICFRDDEAETLIKYSPVLVNDKELNKWITDNFLADELPF
jgi:hypothetical protein